MGREFRVLINRSWIDHKFVCVGLDLDTKNPKFPESAKMAEGPRATLVKFGFDLVDATRDLAAAYKPNLAFFEAHGPEGIYALQQIIRHINEVAPGVPVIADGKRGDIGNTNRGYIEAVFEYLGADALTLHPYLGLKDGMQPFIDRKDKGFFVLARTSNAGAKDYQDLFTLPFDPNDRQELSAEAMLEKISKLCLPLYQRIAADVATRWNVNRNCGVVAGATFPEELKRIRSIVGDDVTILIPAVGEQGGELELAVKYGMDAGGEGFVINSSRGIIFASSGSDYPIAARNATKKLNDQINAAIASAK